MAKKIRNIIFFIKFDGTNLITNIKAYFAASKGRPYIISHFRGFRTEAEAEEYLKALEAMEKSLSFPIINKKKYYE